MGKVRNLQKRSKNLARNWSNLRSESIEKTKGQVLDIISEDQLFNKGIDGLGEKLSSYRSPVYADFKAFLNPNKVTDLRLTGDFVDSFTAKVNGDNILVGATDDKTFSLLFKYGQEVLLLTPENTKAYARGYVLPELQTLVRNAIL